MKTSHESVLLTCIVALATIQIIIVIEMLKLPASRQSVSVFLNSDNVDAHEEQTPAQDDKCHVLKDNYTIVTALIDTGRVKWSTFGRSIKQYLAYGLRLLHLNVPLVVFIEPQFVDFVKFHRRDKKHLTHIVASTFEQLEYYALYSQVKTVTRYIQLSLGDSEFTQHPEVFSPEYVIAVASKISFLQQATVLNPFQSSHFYWIDFGVIRSDNLLPFAHASFPSSPCLPPPRFIADPATQDKVVFLATNPINSLLKNVDEFVANRATPYVKGAFFGGQSEPVKRYHALYRQVFERWLAANLTDDDQSLMVACYFEQPKLFYIAQDHADCFLCHVFTDKS